MREGKISGRIRKKFAFNGKNPQRFDVFVTAQLENIPRKKIQRAIQGGKIKLNGQVAKPKTMVRGNDLVAVDLKIEQAMTSPKPQPEIAIKIAEDHKDFAVIEKPAGISVHPSQHEQSGTVVNWALAQFPQVKNVGEDSTRPGIVHRLDKETSGLLIIAKNLKSFEYFKQLFRERRIKKTYYALCWGNFQKNKGEISTYIGKSPANPLKQATSANPAKLINPKEALTSYELELQGKEIGLVKVSPQTGRKHQIRIHLQSIAHPIVGDKLYSIKKFKARNKKFPHLMLHAQKIEFDFLDGKSYQFKTKLPKEFYVI